MWRLGRERRVICFSVVVSRFEGVGFKGGIYYFGLCFIVFNRNLVYREGVVF